MIAQHKMRDFLTILPAVLYEYILTTDNKGRLLYISPSCEEILGYSQHYFAEDISRFWSLIHPDDFQRFYDENRIANTVKDSFVSEIRLQSPAGGYRWVEISSKATQKEVDGNTIWIGYLIDITARKKVESELIATNHKLEKLAVTDGLTGLYNRRFFDQSLAKEWMRYKRFKEPFSLLLFDIDFFKKYNDRYGHQQGDQCLQIVAEVLQSAARRAGDVVARYGGEEFIILALKTKEKEALEIADRVRKEVESLQIENYDAKGHILTISGGVTSLGAHEYTNEHQMLKAADTALYRAKKDGRNCVCEALGEDHILF